MTTAQIRQDEETSVRETVAGIALPAEIKLNRVSLGIDHDGDPIWQIFFDIPPHADATESLLSSMDEIRGQVLGRVRDLGTDKFPYVRFKVPR